MPCANCHTWIPGPWWVHPWTELNGCYCVYCDAAACQRVARLRLPVLTASAQWYMMRLFGSVYDSRCNLLYRLSADGRLWKNCSDENFDWVFLPRGPAPDDPGPIKRLIEADYPVKSFLRVEVFANDNLDVCFRTAMACTPSSKLFVALVQFQRNWRVWQGQKAAMQRQLLEYTFCSRRRATRAINYPAIRQLVAAFIWRTHEYPTSLATGRARRPRWSRGISPVMRRVPLSVYRPACGGRRERGMFRWGPGASTWSSLCDRGMR